MQRAQAFFEGNQDAVDNGALVEPLRQFTALGHDPPACRALEDQGHALMLPIRHTDRALGSGAQHPAGIERSEYFKLAKPAIAVSVKNEGEAVAAAAFQIAHAIGFGLR